MTRQGAPVSAHLLTSSEGPQSLAETRLPAGGDDMYGMPGARACNVEAAPPLVVHSASEVDVDDHDQRSLQSLDSAHGGDGHAARLGPVSSTLTAYSIEAPWT